MKVLFILMRTDMVSMNPGKAVAQGSHATSQFHRLMENTLDMEAAKNGGVPQGKAADYLEWINQAGTFGTVLTLGVTKAELDEVLIYTEQFGADYGLVVDPTYPLRDGDTTHFFPVATCAWVFGEKDDLAHVLGWLELHP